MSSVALKGDALPVASESPWSGARWSLPALLLVVAAGAWSDAAILFSSPHAMGADGYYYVLQINELLTRGHFYFPTRTPLVLYVLSGISYITGDPVASVKVAGVVLHSLLCLGVFALVAAATRSLWLGVVGGSLVVVSGVHLYMTVEFINQLGALTLLVWGAWCAVRAFHTRARSWALLSLVFFAAASLSHRSAPVLALGVTALAVLTHLLRAEAANGRYRLAALSALLLLWCAPALLASQPFISLPGWARAELLSLPRMPLSKAAAVEQIILLILAPATLALTFLRKRGPRDGVTTLALGAVALWAMLVTINPFLDYGRATGLAWRLSVLAYVQVAILVPGLIWLTDRHQKATLLLAAFVLPLVVGSRVNTRPFSLQPEYVAARAAHLQRLPLYRRQLEADALVISPHGEQFVVTYALGIPSQQRWPEDGGSRTVYWLLHNVPPNFLQPSMLVILKESEGLQTVLAKDADAIRQLRTLQPAEQKWLLAKNPALNEELIRRATAQKPAP